MPVAEEVKPPPPIPPARKSSAELNPVIPPRPPSSAEIVTSAAPLPPPPANSVVVAPPPPVEAPAPAPPSELSELSDAAQEQLAAILHTVLESTLVPALAKQKELEARLEALQKAPILHVRQPTASSLAPVRSTAPSVDITGSFNAGAPAARPSMISTSYGLVSVMPGPAPRPAIEVALERVGPIDVPDFAGNKKFAGGIVIAILILGVVGAILATILSYS